MSSASSGAPSEPSRRPSFVASTVWGRRDSGTAGDAQPRRISLYGQPMRQSDGQQVRFLRITILKAALLQAMFCDLPEADQAEAQAELAAEEKRHQTIERLVHVQRRRIQKELEDAVKQAEVALVPILELRPFKDTLKEVMLQNSIRAALAEASARRDPVALKKLLHQARDANLPQHELQEPTRILAEEELKLESRAALESAKKAKNAPELRGAIASGELAGLAAIELEGYRKVLSNWVIGAAQALLSKAIQSRAIIDLKQAILASERAKIPEEQLVQACLALAEEQLKFAMTSRSTSHLRQAVEDAVRRNVAEAQVKAARELLRFEDAREKARLRLRAAEQSREISEVMASLKEARDCRLEEWELSGAMNVLAEERRRLTTCRV